MKHIGSNKITSSHSTLIEAAEKFVRAAQREPEVNKITLGMISQCKSGRPSIKITETTSGLKLCVRGPRTLQEIYIYTGNPKLVEEILRGTE